MNFVVATLKKEKKFLITLFLISFFIRALFFCVFLSKYNNYWTGDSSDYNDVAQQISKGNGISGLDEKASFLRVPGYSFFLAFFYKFFTQDIKKILLIQVVFTSFIPVLIFIFSMILFPSTVLLAKSVGFLSSISLGFIISSGLVMSDAVFLLFLLLFLILFCSSFELFFCLRLPENISYKRLFLSGIFLGIASLIRPVGQYLVFVSILLLILSSYSWILKVKQSIWFIVGWLGVVVWLLLRNYCLSGGFLFFGTISKIFFLNYTAIPIEMYISKTPFATAQNKVRVILTKKIVEKEKQLNRSLHEIEICILAEKLSFEYLIKEPVYYCKKAFVNLCKTCFDLNAFYYKKTFGNLYIYFLFYEVLILFLLWAGFLFFIVNCLKDLNLLCIFLKVFPFILVFFGLSLAEGFARLRLPIEPFIMIFSCNFWLNILFKRKISYEK